MPTNALALNSQLSTLDGPGLIQGYKIMHRVYEARSPVQRSTSIAAVTRLFHLTTVQTSAVH